MERYGSITEPLWNVVGRYRAITEHYGTLQNITELLWNVAEC